MLLLRILVDLRVFGMVQIQQGTLIVVVIVKDPSRSEGFWDGADSARILFRATRNIQAELELFNYSINKCSRPSLIHNT